MVSESKTSDRPRRAALVVTYVVAAGLGYVLGVRGALPYGALKSSRSTPLARVGLALRDGVTASDGASLALLKNDADGVSAGLGSPERDAFELVAALRGLRSGGRPDYVAASQRCLALKLVRCDPRALELIQKRSAP
ncbi:MAG TPA: hypothetical protein VMI54_07135 [Polyangiaceae bacterium]|nr:hypothetical protein [Polyangiaceae bacterium]